MLTCDSCSVSLPAGAKFCLMCGTRCEHKAVRREVVWCPAGFGKRGFSLAEKPSRVFSLLDARDAQVQPSPSDAENLRPWQEDAGHDWSYRGGMISYSGRFSGATRNDFTQGGWLLIEY